MTEKCVHTEHCCKKHGCKYGDDDCPVETGQKPQSYPCEVCDMDLEDPNYVKLQKLVRMVQEMKCTCFRFLPRSCPRCRVLEEAEK